MSDTGLVARQEWQWAYVLGSFLVAVVGSSTSLLILKQRTSAAGLRHHLLLLAGATSFGAVGVFSMHFVGMEALHLIHPSTGAELAVAYLPLQTAFSLVVVTAIALAGFFLAGDPLQQQWWRYAVTGVAGAGGVLAMHYLGMDAMCMTATIEFSVQWVAVSAVIGWMAVSAALLIFFRWRPYWQHNRAVLAGCSLLLAAAVCGVHYVGMQSATYHILDAATCDQAGLPGHTELLALTLSLSSLACLVALTTLAVQYRQMLRGERRKLTCLTINAVVLDDADQLLTTTQSTLPSAIIESQYLGQGAFDARNGDFLRMLKASTQWPASAEYTAILEGRQLRHSLSMYSFDLHCKFLKAAEELAGRCQLSVADLGLLYWAPTASVVTIVMRVDGSTAERITKTSDLRFLPPSTVFPYIASMDAEVVPSAWMAQVSDYLCKTQTSSPSSFDTPACHEGEKSTSRPSLHFGAHRIVPLPSPAHSKHSHVRAASTEMGPITEDAGLPAVDVGGRAQPSAEESSASMFLGLLYVKVAADGLHVMVLADGPYHEVPMVPLLSTPSLTRTLSPMQSDWLKGLQQHGSPPPGRPVAALPASGREAGGRRLSRQPSHSVEEDGRAGVGEAAGSKEVTPDASPVIPPGAVVQLHQTALHLNLRTHQHALSTSRGEDVAEMGPAGRVKALSPFASSSSVGRSPPSPKTAAFQRSVQSASAGLSALIGSTEDYTATSAVSAQLIALSGGRLLLPMVVTRMRSGRSTQWQEERVRWVWLPTFEALQQRAGAKAAWLTRLLSESGMHSELYGGEGSRGPLRRASSVVGSLHSASERSVRDSAERKSASGKPPREHRAPQSISSGAIDS